MRDASDDRRTRRDIKREATKAAVLHAARRVFLAEGYEGATIKVIADAAHVSPGTVLNAAPSKAALLVAILEEEAETMREVADRLEASLSGDVATRLFALLALILDHKTKQGDLFAAAVGHSWLRSDAAYHAAFEHMDLVWQVVHRALDRGVEAGELRADLDTRQATSMLKDLLLGAMRRGRRDDDSAASAEAQMRARFDLAMTGLRQED